MHGLKDIWLDSGITAAVIGVNVYFYDAQFQLLFDEEAFKGKPISAENFGNLKEEYNGCQYNIFYCRYDNLLY